MGSRYRVLLMVPGSVGTVGGLVVGKRCGSGCWIVRPGFGRVGSGMAPIGGFSWELLQA